MEGSSIAALLRINARKSNNAQGKSLGRSEGRAASVSRYTVNGCADLLGSPRSLHFICASRRETIPVFIAVECRSPCASASMSAGRRRIELLHVACPSRNSHARFTNFKVSERIAGPIELHLEQDHWRQSHLAQNDCMTLHSCPAGSVSDRAIEIG